MESRGPRVFWTVAQIFGTFPTHFSPESPVSRFSRSSSMAFAVFETERARDQVNRTAQKHKRPKRDTENTFKMDLFILIYL